MSNFYEDWLSQSERVEQLIQEAPRVAREKELKWVQTRQDARAALMIAPEAGFPTAGSVLMKAEIPVGWHTGAHLHGEEFGDRLFNNSRTSLSLAKNRKLCFIESSL